MEQYCIMMDVSGDIEEELIQKYSLRFIPMEYSLGDEMRVCHDKEPEEVLKRFYDGQRGGDLTRTTQINPQIYEENFESILKMGTSILYLCLSGGLSQTYQSALKAKAALKEKYPDADVFVVDSLAATGGMGVLCERACRNRAKGMSVQENFEDIVAATGKVRHWFMVRDLMYLKRGGRIGAATAVVGSLLGIRPILKIDETGKLVTIDKKRGDNGAVNALVERFRQTYDGGDDVVYIIHSDAADLAASLKNKIQAEYPEVTIRESMLSPIIGAHTGPGMIAVCHIGK